MSAVIAIWSKRDDQKLPRPFNRASNPDEAMEMLRVYVDKINWVNFNTDEPIGTGIRYGTKYDYYAFFE